MTFFERFPKYLLEAPSWPEKKHGVLVPPGWRDGYDLTEVDLLYVLGIGDGSPYTGLQPWLRENSTRKVVFLEEDPAALWGLLDAPMFADPQVDFELIEADTIHRFAQKYPALRAEVIALPDFPPSRFRKIRLDLLRKTALSSAHFIDRLYGHQLFGQFVKNVPRFQGAFYANGLKGAFSEMPAVICGAGPSLQEAIPVLRAMEGRALILAGGSAVAALTSAGIQPHFGLAIDPNIEEFHRFCNAFFPEGPLILSTRVHPGVFDTCNGPFGYIRSGLGGAAEAWLEKELGLQEPLLAEHMSDESMSVTTLAVAFAAHLGCKTIALTGVDLAYTGGKRYAPGVCKETPIDGRHVGDRLVKRKGKSGKYLTTAVRWVMEAASLASFAKKHSAIRWINGAEEGLRIDGFEDLPLARACDLHMRETFDIRGKIDREIELHPMPHIPDDILQKLEASLARTIHHLEILAGVKRGSKALAEWDLEGELAVQALFADMPRISAQARNLGVTSGEWQFYLDVVLRQFECCHRSAL